MNDRGSTPNSGALNSTNSPAAAITTAPLDIISGCPSVVYLCGDHYLPKRRPKGVRIPPPMRGDGDGDGLPVAPSESDELPQELADARRRLLDNRGELLAELCPLSGGSKKERFHRYFAYNRPKFTLDEIEAEWTRSSESGVTFDAYMESMERSIPLDETSGLEDGELPLLTMNIGPEPSFHDRSSNPWIMSQFLPPWVKEYQNDPNTLERLRVFYHTHRSNQKSLHDVLRILKRCSGDFEKMWDSILKKYAPPIPTIDFKKERCPERRVIFERLKNFYLVHAPTKAYDTFVEQIVDRYEGRPDDLQEALKKKYGDDPFSDDERYLPPTISVPLPIWATPEDREHLARMVNFYTSTAPGTRTFQQMVKSVQRYGPRQYTKMWVAIGKKYNAEEACRGEGVLFSPSRGGEFDTSKIPSLGSS